MRGNLSASLLNRWGLALPTFLAWGSVAGIVFLLFHYLGLIGAQLAITPPFTRAARAALPYLAALQPLDLWASGFVVLVAVYRDSAVYRSQTQYAPYMSMVRATASLLLAGIVLGGLSSLAALGPIFPSLAVIAFGALAGVSIGHLAQYAAEHSILLVGTLARWAAASPFRNANIGAFVVLYAVFLRPTLHEVFAYAPLLEWTGVLVVCLYIMQRTWANVAVNQAKPALTARTVGEDEEGEEEDDASVAAEPAKPVLLPPSMTWRTHRQEIVPVPDSLIESAIQDQEMFLADGDATRFIMRLATAMGRGRVHPDRIAATIEPLVSYRDPQFDPLWVWFVPGARQRRLEQQRIAIHQRVQRLLKEAEEATKYGAAPLVPGEQLLDSAAEAFVRSSQKGALVTAAVLTSLERNAWEGSSRLPPYTLTLLHYNDAVAPWSASPRRRRLLALVDRRRRRQLARELVQSLKARPLPERQRSPQRAERLEEET
ncbi:MAG: hypothetical protein HY685_01405 [Chloroflexi bacterium]|nr:hypothetical protein [Chloroflexota bacterium]